MNRIRVLFKKKDMPRNVINTENNAEADWVEFPSPESLLEIVGQIEYFLSFIDYIIETGMIEKYPKSSQGRLLHIYRELECLFKEAHHLNDGIGTYEFQLKTIKNEIISHVKLYPDLQDEEKREMETVLQKFDVFLHARWTVIKHSKNLLKLENFLKDVKKRVTTLDNMVKCANLGSKTSTLFASSKASTVNDTNPTHSCKNKPSTPSNTAASVPIKRTARPFKRRRPPEATVTPIRTIQTSPESKNTITLYPIALLERKYKLQTNNANADHTKTAAHSFSTGVILPLEYVDQRDHSQNVSEIPTVSANGITLSSSGNRDSTSNTSLSNNIHTGFSCMMQALFGETASTTSVTATIDSNNNISLSTLSSNLFSTENDLNSDIEIDIMNTIQ